MQLTKKIGLAEAVLRKMRVSNAEYVLEKFLLGLTVLAKIQAYESEARDAAGKWTSGGGGFKLVGKPHYSPGEAEHFFWHGTHAEALNHIKKNGLIPSRGKGADILTAEQYERTAREFATSSLGLTHRELAGALGVKPGETIEDAVRAFKTKALSKLKLGDRAVSVYVTSDHRLASEFAVDIAKYHRTEPVMLRVRIPESKAASLVKDELVTGNAHRFIGRIPPEWIDHAVEVGGKAVFRALLKAAERVYYVVIPVVDSLTKVVPYKQAKPYRDEDVAITGRSGASDGGMKNNGYFSELGGVKETEDYDEEGKWAEGRKGEKEKIKVPMGNGPDLQAIKEGTSLAWGDDVQPGSRMRVTGRKRVV